MERDAVVWILMAPDLVPERWAGRVRQLAALPLLPEEVDAFLDKGRASPALSAEDEEIARHVASGCSPREIADSLHLAERTVYRRLARLRKRVGATTAEELAAKLARYGF